MTVVIVANGHEKNNTAKRLQSKKRSNENTLTPKSITPLFYLFPVGSPNRRLVPRRLDPRPSAHSSHSTWSHSCWHQTGHRRSRVDSSALGFCRQAHHGRRGRPPLWRLLQRPSTSPQRQFNPYCASERPSWLC